MVIDGSNGLTYPNGATNGGYINGSTAVATTSGTAINFTGIPTWVKRISFIWSGVSSSGSSNYLIQVGASSYATSGYLNNSFYTVGSSGAAQTSTSGFQIYHDTASNVRNGIITLDLLDSSTNSWSCNGFTGDSSSSYTMFTAGSIALSGSLNQIRATTVNGTDTFTAGKMNIFWE